MGVDAEHAHAGPAKPSRLERAEDRAQLDAIAPDTDKDATQWKPGDAPSQALRWAVRALAKAGTLSIIGVYPATAKAFPLGDAMGKNLTINMGNCNHRKYIPELIDCVRTGRVDPSAILTQREPLLSAIDAYRAFDARAEGWMKVALRPAA